MDQKVFEVGSEVMVAEDAPGGLYSAFFEDDGETGYFYAVDLRRSDNMILVRFTSTMSPVSLIEIGHPLCL